MSEGIAECKKRHSLEELVFGRSSLAIFGHLAIACSNLSLLGQLGKFWNGACILMRHCCNPSQVLRREYHLVDPSGHTVSRPTDVDVSFTSWVTRSAPRLLSHIRSFG